MSAQHITLEIADEFAVGSLESAAERDVALHVAACEPCAELVAEAERVASALSLALPVVSAPDSLRKRTLAVSRPSRGRHVRRVLAYARAGSSVAAALIAVAALTGMLVLRHQVDDLNTENDTLKAQVDDALSTKVEIAALTRRLSDAERSSSEQSDQVRNDRELLLAMLSPQSDVAEVYSTDASRSAIGQMVWNPDQKRVWFIADNLPVRPANETYQLWVSEGGNYESLGTFQPDATGFARYSASVPEGMTGYDACVVTIEKAGGAPERSGPSVFAADLSRFRH